jgi:hypothetical protein
MTKAERFALNQWLSDYPENLSYDEIITILNNSETEWMIDDICVWEAVEDHPYEKIAEFINDTRQAFERAIA